MAQITEYVFEHHREDIKLPDIAKYLGYDYHYVSRYFNSLFNMSFKDFLNTYRLETAIELLENSEKSILDIALESGYQSVRTFNNCFKAYFGINPSKYKKNLSSTIKLR